LHALPNQDIFYFLFDDFIGLALISHEGQSASLAGG